MSYENELEETNGDINSGICYRSAVSGLWYRNLKAAGEVSEVMVNGVNFKSGEEAIKERDELKAELERVKPDLKYIKATLPETKDGYPVILGDDYYYFLGEMRVQVVVTGICRNESEGETIHVEYASEEIEVVASELFESSESCLKSTQSKEGGEA
jgi:hypothetical protein